MAFWFDPPGLLGDNDQSTGTLPETATRIRARRREARVLADAKMEIRGTLVDVCVCRLAC